MSVEEDILSFPSIGKRMLHEFKECRPYESLDRFPRETGKYVSEAEVARFQRYVTIN